MTPADIVLIFVIILALGGYAYYHYLDKKYQDAQ